MDDKAEFVSHEKNNDIRFLYNKVNRGYHTLSYWISNDDFAQEIRKIKDTNTTIDVRVIFDIAYDIYTRNLELRKSSASNPDFMFDIAEKSLVSLQFQMAEKNPQRVPDFIFVPENNENMAYLLDICVDLSYETKIHLVSDPGIVKWLRKHDKANNLQEVYEIVKVLFFKVIRHGWKNSDRIEENRLYLRLRRMIMDFSLVLFNDERHWHKEYQKYTFEKGVSKTKKAYLFNDNTLGQDVLYKKISGLHGGWLMITEGKPVTLDFLKNADDFNKIERINSVLDDENTVWEDLDTKDVSYIREWFEIFRFN